MKRVSILLVIALLGGCKGFTLGIFDSDPNQPSVQVEDPDPVRQVPERYRHLQQRESFSPKSSTNLKSGCYLGDFVLGSSQLRISGAGVEETVIHGNLVLQTQCEVSNLTVTGDVIFQGSQAELKNVDFLGEIIDHGSQNRY